MHEFRRKQFNSCRYYTFGKVGGEGGYGQSQTGNGGIVRYWALLGLRNGGKCKERSRKRIGEREREREGGKGRRFVTDITAGQGTSKIGLEASQTWILMLLWWRYWRIGTIRLEPSTKLLKLDDELLKMPQFWCIIFSLFGSVRRHTSHSCHLTVAIFAYCTASGAIACLGHNSERLNPEEDRDLHLHSAPPLSLSLSLVQTCSLRAERLRQESPVRHHRELLLL